MKKIVIIGPESTGKSTLCSQLAEHYQTLWCPEYAREYLEENGTSYTYDDLLAIAKGQLALEDQFTEAVQKASTAENLKQKPEAVQQTVQQSTTNQPLLFIDTDMQVMKVWCDYVFGKCHEFILHEIEKRQYDLYLLCNVDLPWVKDELREYPDFRVRENLFEIYKGILTNQQVPWVTIYGNYEARLYKGIEAVDRLVVGKSGG